MVTLTKQIEFLIKNKKAQELKINYELYYYYSW